MTTPSRDVADRSKVSMSPDYKRSLAFRFALAVLPLVVVVLASIGWAAAHDWDVLGHGADIFVRSIKVFVPDSANFQGGNAATQIAAVVGILSTVAGASALWLSAFGKTLSDARTRWLRCDHVLVLGDTPFTDRLMHDLAETDIDAVRIVEPPDDGRTPAGDDRLAIGYDHDDLVAAAGLARAAHVVIDLGGDYDTTAVAADLIHRLGAAPGTRLKSLALRVSDRLLGAHLVDRATAARRAAGLARPTYDISIFDENAQIARRLLAVEPLYRRAVARRQGRVHALIVGFGDLGEKILDRVFTTSLAGDLDFPRVTVIDAEAVGRAAAFRARRPGVTDHLAIEFLQLRVGETPLEGAPLDAAALRLGAIEAECPFTAIHVCLPSDGDTVAAVLALRRHHDRTGGLAAPIFCGARRDFALLEPIATATPPLDADHGVVCFDLDARLRREMVFEGADRDPTAKWLHAGYRESGLASAAADLPWEDLPETLRLANVRAADRLTADLWTLGLDEATGLSTAADRARIAALLERGEDDPVLRGLMRCEHDRWCIDRWLEGWRHGETRDDVGRRHPLLVPWERLADRPGDRRKDLIRVTMPLRRLLDAGTSPAESTR